MPPRAAPPGSASESVYSTIAERLGDAKDWQGRCGALRDLSARLRSTGLDEAELCALRDSKCAARLASQLLDLRSEVTREASAAVTALAERGGALPSFPALAAEVLTPPLLRLVAVPHKVMSDQGHAAASALFAAAASHRLLARLAEAQTERRSPALLRARCAEYLCAALRAWPPDALLRDPGPLEDALLAGVGDAAPEVRRFSKASFELYRSLQPQRAARLLARMDAAGACGAAAAAAAGARSHSPARRGGSAAAAAEPPPGRRLAPGRPSLARSLSPPPARVSMHAPPVARLSRTVEGGSDSAAPSASVAAALARIRRYNSAPLGARGAEAAAAREEEREAALGEAAAAAAEGAARLGSPPVTARYRAYRQARAAEAAEAEAAALPLSATLPSRPPPQPPQPRARTPLSARRPSEAHAAPAAGAATARQPLPGRPARHPSPAPAAASAASAAAAAAARTALRYGVASAPGAPQAAAAASAATRLTRPAAGAGSPRRAPNSPRRDYLPPPTAGGSLLHWGVPGRSPPPPPPPPPPPHRRVEPRRYEAPPPEPSPHSQAAEEEILKSIAHLDSLIASIHARGVARSGRGGAAAAPDVHAALSASTRALLGRLE